MKVIVTPSFEDSCRVVADAIIAQVKADPSSKLGLATGGTAEAVYPHLVKAHQSGEVDFSGITTVNLDEYIGMDPSHPQSYRQCMDRWFFDPIGIDKSRTFVAGGSKDIDAEIKRFNEKLYGDKLIDLQLLGVGISGHIGFNEPHESLTAGVHTEDLDESTIAANARFFDSPDEVPRKSITMGVGDIMKAAKIVLIATGDNKAPVMKELLMNDSISCKIPVTVLKMHRDATIVIDQALADTIGYHA